MILLPFRYISVYPDILPHLAPFLEDKKGPIGTLDAFPLTIKITLDAFLPSTRGKITLDTKSSGDKVNPALSLSRLDSVSAY